MPHSRKKSYEEKTIKKLIYFLKQYQIEYIAFAVGLSKYTALFREKGFYVGDGCYTALAHMVLTGDDSMVRKLIDDAFACTFITPGMVTCLDCSLMQEIAEYPLYLVSLVLWHYRLTGDRAYLSRNYTGVVSLLENYRTVYEKDHLLHDGCFAYAVRSLHR